MDCRVDQDKGLISIVENKLAASSQEEGERGAAGGGACTGHRLQYGRRRSGRRMRMGLDGMRWISADDLVKVRRAARRRDGLLACSPTAKVDDRDGVLPLSPHEPAAVAFMQNNIRCRCATNGDAVPSYVTQSFLSSATTRGEAIKKRTT